MTNRTAFFIIEKTRGCRAGSPDFEICVRHRRYNFIRQAMTGTSNVGQQHTESSRLMRGAWKTGREYIPELHTQRPGRVGCDGFLHTLSCWNASGCRRGNRQGEALEETQKAQAFCKHQVVPRDVSLVLLTGRGFLHHFRKERRKGSCSVTTNWWPGG